MHVKIEYILVDIDQLYRYTYQQAIKHCLVLITLPTDSCDLYH